MLSRTKGRCSSVVQPCHFQSGVKVKAGGLSRKPVRDQIWRRRIVVLHVDGLLFPGPEAWVENELIPQLQRYSRSDSPLQGKKAEVLSF